MAFPMRNNMSLYIPVVQKYHGSVDYFKNVFYHNSIGKVHRVDFVARDGGDPELAKELSAFVYLEWFNNEFAYNWQKVIIEKDPNMPARLYHMVGPNYWILAENMKPRTPEQVAEEKAVVVKSQTQKIEELERDNFKMKLEIAKLKAGTPITMNAPYQTDAEKIQKLEKQLEESDQKVTKLTNELAKAERTARVPFGYELVSILDDLKTVESNNKKIASLEKQLEESDQKVTKLTNDLANAERTAKVPFGYELVSVIEHLKTVESNDKKIAALEKQLEESDQKVTKLTNDLEKEQVQILARKNKKIKELQEKITTVKNDRSRVQSALDALEYEFTVCKMNEEDAKEKEKAAVLELETLKKSMPEPVANINNVRFSCNGCSKYVSFTTETNATKLHLCHDCFAKTGAWLH